MNEDRSMEGAPSGAPSPHPLSDGPLPFGKIMDVGLLSYHEFACSRQTLSWMQATGIPTDGELQIVEQCLGGHNVVVKVWQKEPRASS